MLGQLIERWKKAFDEIGSITNYRGATQTLQYAAEPCFELEKYTKTDFPQGKPFSGIPDNDSHPYYKYGLNRDGLPCYTSFPNNGNTTSWEGYYTYSDDLVEYVEFNIETRMPSRIDRLVFSGQRKVSFQQILINTGASAPAYIGLSKDDGIAMILDHEGYSIQARIQNYEYDGDRIIGADCFSMFPGAGKYEYKRLYSYNETDELEEITDLYPNGIRQLSYLRIEEGDNAQTISDRLALRLAESVVDTLIKNEVESPVAIVELGYQYVGNYTPVVVSRPESYKKEVIDKGGKGIWEGLFLGFRDLLYLDPENHERLFVQFMQIIEETGDHEMGQKMLRNTAALLTKSRLFGKVPVSDEFVTYAIDNSIEGHDKEDFKHILNECGLEEEVIEAWDKKGWLRP